MFHIEGLPVVIFINHQLSIPVSLPIKKSSRNDISARLKGNKAVDSQVDLCSITYGHELWLITERMRVQMQEAEMSFL